MELELARIICAEYLASDGSYDLSALTRREFNAYRHTVAEAASALMEIGSEDEQEMGATIQRIAPALWDYDRAGNYIGEVRHENGWTA